MSYVIYNENDGSVEAIHHEFPCEPTPLKGQDTIKADLPSGATPSDYVVRDGEVVQS